jgi:hypothetical protein
MNELANEFYTEFSEEVKWLIMTYENFSTCLGILERHITTILRSISSLSQRQLFRKQRAAKSPEDVGKGAQI